MAAVAAITTDGSRLGMMMQSSSMASVGTPCARDLGSGHGALLVGSKEVSSRLSNGRLSRQQLQRRNPIVKAKVATGTRNENTAGKVETQQRIALNRLIQPTTTTTTAMMSSGAMEELELERGVCNPFRKYTPERVSKSLLFQNPNCRDAIAIGRTNSSEVKTKRQMFQDAKNSLDAIT